MRQIKFKGQTLKGGKWVYGYYRQEGTRHLIYDTDTEIIWVVDPKTVGQYTGLKDKNGVEIYENDIVEYSRVNAAAKGIVMFEFGKFYIEDRKRCLFVDFEYDEPVQQACKVLGNIFDNPDLLKSEVVE
jgi:uncharacterized phage protein (TIGR01671 family)